MIFLEKRVAHTSARASRGAATLPAGSRLVPLLLLAVLLASTGAGCTSSDAPAAEESAAEAPAAPSDTLALSALADTLAPEQAARYALHGRDLEGKDGPMAKLGYDLARLYFAYRAHQREMPAQPFEPPGATPMRVADGRVTIDATAAAAEGAEALQADLERLGLANGAAAGPLVSGRLPIEALPKAAGLESLRSMRPSAARTPSQPPPPAPVGGDSDSSRAPF